MSEKMIWPDCANEDNRPKPSPQEAEGCICGWSQDRKLGLRYPNPECRAHDESQEAEGEGLERDWEASYDDLGKSFLELGAVVLEVCGIINSHPEDETGTNESDDLLSEIKHRLEDATTKASELAPRRYLAHPSEPATKVRAEPENEECPRCRDRADHFELAEDFEEVAHTFLRASHGYCLTCNNHSAHPWHVEAPALKGFKEIEKYLDTMGFRVVSKALTTPTPSVDQGEADFWIWQSPTNDGDDVRDEPTRGYTPVYLAQPTQTVGREHMAIEVKESVVRDGLKMFHPDMTEEMIGCQVRNLINMTERAILSETDHV